MNLCGAQGAPVVTPAICQRWVFIYEFWSDIQTNKQKLLQWESETKRKEDDIKATLKVYMMLF